MNEIIEAFIAMVYIIEDLRPVYQQPGDGSDGTCDCIGLIIGAIRRMGLKWTGIHGCNWAARKEVSNLAKLTKAGQLKVGDVVFKSRGTSAKDYKLPDRYKKGEKYYNGDLLDYYHAGVVTKINPVEITHMSGSGVLKAYKLDKWTHFGQLDILLKAAGQPINKNTESQKTADTTMPTEGATAIVTAGSGSYVKMRRNPTTCCKYWENVPIGAKVTLVQPGETWAKITYGKRKGWYMMAKYLDIKESA